MGNIARAIIVLITIGVISKLHAVTYYIDALPATPIPCFSVHNGVSYTWYQRKTNLTDSTYTETPKGNWTTNFTAGTASDSRTHPVRFDLGYKVAGVWYPVVAQFGHLSGDPAVQGNWNQAGDTLTQTGTGAVLDPATGNPTTPTKYEKDIPLTNNTSKALTYNLQITRVDSVVRDSIITLQSGESATIHIEEDVAFAYVISHLVETPITSVEGNDPVPAVSVDSSGAGVAAYSGTADPDAPVTGSAPATAGITAEAAAGTATPSSGATAQTNDNANTNSSNIGAKIDRGTTTAKNASDLAHKDANGIKDLLGQTGSTAGGTAANTAITGPTGAQGVLGFIGKIGMIGTDLTAIAGMLSAPASGGDASYNVEIAMGGHLGTKTLNLDQFDGAYGLIRILLLLLLIVYAMFAAMKILRGAIVDES